MKVLAGGCSLLSIFSIPSRADAADAGTSVRDQSVADAGRMKNLVPEYRPDWFSGLHHAGSVPGSILVSYASGSLFRRDSVLFGVVPDRHDGQNAGGWQQSLYSSVGHDVDNLPGVDILTRPPAISAVSVPSVPVHELGNVVDCVSQAVAGEARGEEDTGKVGIANVIVNRLNAWGGSYCSRVYDQHAGVCQFDGVCHHHPAYPHEVVEQAKTVALAAVTGKLHDVTGGALFFHVCHSGSERDPAFTVRIQSHCYFKSLPVAMGASSKGKKTQPNFRSTRSYRNIISVQRIDYHLIPDEKGKYGFRLAETRKT